ncbi:hypothetical protein Tco_0743524 [Tanacetum coccineum]
MADGAKGLTRPEQTATGKGILNPFMDDYGLPKSPYGVNRPGSDESRLKLYDVMYKIVNCCDLMDDERALKNSCAKRYKREDLKLMQVQRTT